MNMLERAQKAKDVSVNLAATPTEKKNEALKTIVASLKESQQLIFEANNKDIEISEKNNLAAPLLKRLKFDAKKLQSVIDGINSLVNLPDPSGKVLDATELDKGLELYKVSCPIGTVGIIFESRPDALVQISTLCLKSGNSVLLKGGSEAENTNKVLVNIIQKATTLAGITEGWIHLMETRSDVNEMLNLDNLIDLIIPRGSNEFVRYIMDNSNIPVLGHADGICHVYIDSACDYDMAKSVAVDSKTQYVAVCNAAETLLVHKDVAKEILPAIKEAMDKKGVQLFGCEHTREIINTHVASEESFKTEYLDLKMSVKVVDSANEAIKHINKYGSGHTDTIVTNNKPTADLFINLVDSANVFWNCSTRFSDGYRYGLGAEVGISTNKIHARGPVGLEGMVIYKWKLMGAGQIVSDYADGGKCFTHKKL
jgi:glutamate-5-semialdehyde dehydrogenase